MTESSGLNVAGVYWYISLSDQKRYIGSSINIRHRKKEHESSLKKGTNSEHFQNAWNKYGADNFAFEVVEEVPLPAYRTKSGLTLKDFKALVWRPILAAREQYYLDLWKNKYNICPIAYSRLGSKQPEGFGEQASKRMKVYMSQPEIAEKYRRHRLNHTWDELFGVEKAADMKRRGVEKHRETGWFPENYEPPNKGVPMSDAQKMLLQAARAAYVAEYGVWNEGLTWDETFGPNVSAERKAKYAHLADKWFGIAENRERHHKAMVKGTQERVEREGKHWKEGSVQTTETRRAITVAKGAPLYLFQGEKRTVAEIARLVGLDRATLRDRLDRGEPLDHAIRPELSKGGAKLGHATSAATAAKIRKAQKGKPRDWQKGKSSKPTRSGEFGISELKTGKFKVRLEGKFRGTYMTKEEAVVRRDEVLMSLQQQAKGKSNA